MENNKQLYEKIGNEYKEVFPLNFIDNIVDKVSGKTLAEIIASYNNIYVPYKGTAETTRNAIPVLLRRRGLWISYNIEDKSITEKYIGTTQDVTSNWANDDNWEKIPDVSLVQVEAGKLPDGIITPSKLSPALQQLINEHKTIYNLPDDEDLEEVNGVIRFKDREYNPLLDNSKGYKILRRNWIGGKNVLTQDMINNVNTIYEIRYDFDLNGQEITIPEGCVLDFKGGSLSNGTIIGDNTNITADAIKIFNNINIKGTYNCKARVEWFSNEDFQKTLDSFKYIILLPNKEYTINKTIVFPYNGIIEGEGNSVIKTITNTPVFRLGYNSKLFNFDILVDSLSTIIRIDNENLALTYANRNKQYSLVNSGIFINNIHIKVNYQYHTYNGNSINAIEIINNGTTPTYNGFWGINIKDVSIAGGFKYAIYCDTGSAEGITTNNMWITDCIFDRIVCSRVWCFLYMGTNNKGIGKGAKIGGGWLFRACSMQSFKDDTYINTKFIILKNATKVTFDKCIGWDFTHPYYEIDYSCEEIEINGCSRAQSSKVILLTGTNNSNILPYTYTKSSDNLSKGEFFYMDYTEGGKATYESAFSKILEGYSEIEKGYLIFDWLGLDRELLRINDNASVMLHKITTYSKTLIELWFDGNIARYVWCSYNNSTKKSVIEWHYSQSFPTSYSKLPNPLSDSDFCSKGKLDFLNNRIINVISKNLILDNDGRTLIPLSGNESEIPNTENFRNEDYGLCYYNKSSTMPIFYNHNLRKFLYADGSELKAYRVGPTKTTRKIPLGTVVYDSTFEKIFIATKVTKNIDNEFYTIEWKDENGYSPTKKKGTTAERPIINSVYEGFEYYDSTLKKKIIWDGVKWTDFDNNSVDSLKQGTTQQRPTEVKAGFYYFDTTLNKPIWKKDDTSEDWVDATGAKV